MKALICIAVICMLKTVLAVCPNETVCDEGHCCLYVGHTPQCMPLSKEGKRCVYNYTEKAVRERRHTYFCPCEEGFFCLERDVKNMRFCVSPES